MANALKVALGLAVSAGFLYLAFRGVELTELWKHVRRADSFWLLGVAGVTIYSNWTRAQRWGLFFRHLKRISPYSLFIACGIFPRSCG